MLQTQFRPNIHVCIEGEIGGSGWRLAINNWNCFFFFLLSIRNWRKISSAICSTLFNWQTFGSGMDAECTCIWEDANKLPNWLPVAKWTPPSGNSEEFDRVLHPPVRYLLAYPTLTLPIDYISIVYKLCSNLQFFLYNFDRNKSMSSQMKSKPFAVTATATVTVTGATAQSSTDKIE